VAERIVVVGMLGGRPAVALPRADLVVGGRRLLEAAAPTGVRTVAVEADVSAVLDEIAAEPGVVVVLASGDPGFFGIGRQLAARFGAERLEVHPAPTSVALAFARLGVPWDDAAVVSGHGRPLDDAAAVAARTPKVAVLVSPAVPPESLGKELLARGAPHGFVAVCTRLGRPDESVTRTDLAGLAAGTFDPLSVVVLLLEDPAAGPRTLAWGVPDDGYAHRAGMVTKAEVRAVALGKLDLPPAGVLWDVGAGSGSVAVECARLAPGLLVLAVERRADDCARIAANAARHGARVAVTQGEAPAAFAGLPDPDRVFVGGGGIEVLDAAVDRLRPGGRVVAAFAALDRAAAAADRLGSLVQVGVSRGRRLPDGGLRLEAENPVFVVWGPIP
jgi:precorrin-6Y C5,15-methyltransferase (decarboxylating)